MNSKDFKKKIKDLLIVKNDDESYYLFGQYHIIKKDSYYTLTDLENGQHVFSTLRHAVTYCVFKKNNKLKDVKRIKELDDLLGSLDVAIAQHQRLATNSNDPEVKQIYLAKLGEEKLKKQIFRKELEEYVNFSKWLQTQNYKSVQV